MSKVSGSSLLSVQRLAVSACPVRTCLKRIRFALRAISIRAQDELLITVGSR